MIATAIITHLGAAKYHTVIQELLMDTAIIRKRFPAKRTGFVMDILLSMKKINGIQAHGMPISSRLTKRIPIQQAVMQAF